MLKYKTQFFPDKNNVTYKKVPHHKPIVIVSNVGEISHEK